MKIIAIVAASALLACSPPPTRKPETGEDHAAKPRAALVGKPAPRTELDVLDGERVVLQDLVGHKPVYLKFWATWCVPCRKQVPHLEAAHRTYGDRLAIFAIDLGLNDSLEAIREFQTANAMTVPVAIDSDGSLTESYRVAVTPMHVLIDRAGIVRHVGFDANDELDRALEAVLQDARPGDLPPRVERAVDAPLSLSLLDGSTFTLAAHAGRPLALAFVTTSCDWYLARSRPAMAEACIAHAKQVEALSQTSPRVRWVAIAHPVWSSTDSLHKYRKRLAVSLPIGLDETAAWFHHFGVRDVPTTILLDERGVEIARVRGQGDELPRALAQLR